MRNFILLIVSLICFYSSPAQKQKADSLKALLAKEKSDTGRVILMWQIAETSNLYNPESSVRIAQQALYLAQKIKYKDGESISLAVLATALSKIGNYPKALEFYLQKLQLEEKRNNPRNLASALINIGTVYTQQEQYRDALIYYRKADSVIQLHGVADLQYYSYQDLGDVYWRLHIIDSSFSFFNKAFEVAAKLNDKNFMGISMVGLGHVYIEQHNLNSALYYYLQALVYLEPFNDDDIICETTLGLARVYDYRNMNDSAEYYAIRSSDIAKKGGFESRQLEAATFLTEHFKKTGDIKNAFTYIEMEQAIKDSIYSKEKIRESQIISNNEQLRQNEISENKKREEKERQQQLQILLIGIFIPVLFLVTLLLNKVKTHQRIIKFLGILSLLLLFEYLLLFLNPRVGMLTNHNPIYEIIIFVVIASVLAPTHHRIEHW
ncbi:MAG: tetratricopeptide repeat protein, partial [Ginsengibacter sp.]